MVIQILDSALVVLVGVAGSGKSTFADAHFRATEVLSSDFFRGMVSDDEANQDASADAFELLRLAMEKRLRRGKLTVVDATNVRREHRTQLIQTAHSFGRPAIAIVLETPLLTSIERAGTREARSVEADVIRRQAKDLASQTDEGFLREGFACVYRVNPADRIFIQRTQYASRDV